MPELKPCPFCGGEAELNKTEAKNIFPYRVSHACHAIGNGIVTTGCVSPEEAIKAWNTRAERTCHKVVGKYGHRWSCSECDETLLPGYPSTRYPDGIVSYCPSCGAKVIGD